MFLKMLYETLLSIALKDGDNGIIFLYEWRKRVKIVSNGHHWKHVSFNESLQCMVLRYQNSNLDFKHLFLCAIT